MPSIPSSFVRTVVSKSGRLRAVAATLSMLALAALSPLLARAQIAATSASISGRVTDKANGQGLAGAHVSIIGTKQGTVVRQDGGYRLALPAGRHVLLINYVGYSPIRDTIDVASGQSLTRDYSLATGGVQLDAAIVTGTRATDRTVLGSPVPIDVLSAATIQSTGAVETSQVIQLLAPSFNFPRPTIADGTDHVRPSTLRGLGPDQVLVLINGKRRHTSALVNVNGTVGRGSTGADLNAIPSSSIERIEILRDGAAAQYGSDAIAGVINIILKSDASTDAEVEVGQSNTTLAHVYTKLSDGDVSTVAVNTGRFFSSGGFLHVTGQWENRGSTNRSLPDTRRQYFPGDPRNADPLLNGRIDFRQGDARVNDLSLFANAALPAFSNGAQVYAFGGASRRKGQSAGFWRMPSNVNTIRSIYPNGFLPMINSTIPDYSGVVGVKGNLLGWAYDLSGSNGYNRFDFNITNTDNATLGNASPTQFYAGSLKFNQSTANIDVVRGFPIAAFATPLNVAIGVEGRRDSYGIVAGEPDSYRDGGVRVLDGPNIGALTTPGAQVFAGFRPSDAGTHSRTNYAGYVDLETNLLERLLVGIAGRTEHYSDFGSTTTGKATTRLELFPGFAIRGAVASGFRAPSLAQEFFSSAATNFLNLGAGLVPVEIRTLPVSSGAAKALGALPLKAEKSRNTSFGATFAPLSNLSLTADYYHIDIDDRIVLSGNFTGAAMTAFLASQGFPGVGSARYFTNAIDTRTKGVDVVGRYAVDLQEAGIARFTVGYNQTGTHVTRIASTPTALAAQQSVLFDRLERSRLEEGQPRRTLSLTMDNTFKRVNTAVHVTRFGEVGTRGATSAALDQKYGAKWITDANIGLALVSNFRLTLGVNNLFDVYPDENLPVNNNSGILPYNGISPFGFNGRFIFARLRWER